MATLVNKMNREVKVIIPNMREFRVFYSDNEGSTMFFKRDWEEEKTTKQEEQVWSEEDEGELQNAIDALEFLGKKGIYKSESGYNAALQAAFWLKSLLERIIIQPKQEWREVELEFRGEKVKVKRPFFRDDKGRGYSTTEQDEEVAWNALRAWCEKKGISLYDLYPKVEWSEEDEEMYARVVRRYTDYEGVIMRTKEESVANKMLDVMAQEEIWLKSILERFNLQPNNEWSEEDRKMYKMLSSMIHGTFVVETQETQDKLLSWLKAISSRPKSSDNWKPSEEQIKTLDIVISDYRHACTKGSDKKAEILEPLLEQLKKLM